MEWLFAPVRLNLTQGQILFNYFIIELHYLTVVKIRKLHCVSTLYQFYSYNSTQKQLYYWMHSCIMCFLRNCEFPTTKAIFWPVCHLYNLISVYAQGHRGCWVTWLVIWWRFNDIITMVTQVVQYEYSYTGRSDIQLIIYVSMFIIYRQRSCNIWKLNKFNRKTGSTICYTSCLKSTTVCFYIHILKTIIYCKISLKTCLIFLAFYKLFSWKSGTYTVLNATRLLDELYMLCYLYCHYSSIELQAEMRLGCREIINTFF